MFQFLKHNRKAAVFSLVIALLAGIMAGGNIYTQKQWGKRVESWNVIHAEVCYNTGTYTGYKYKVGENDYLGKSVTYGFALPKDRIKGTDILCIVNPEAPGESAALVHAVGLENHLRRYRPSLICIPLCLICLVTCFIGFCKKKPEGK